MIINRQRHVRVPLRQLEMFAGRVEQTLGLRERDWTVSMVSDAEIARLNRAFRGKRGPTDVLSFPANAARRRRRATQPERPGAGAAVVGAISFASYLGDIAISPETAQSNARRARRTLPEELRILILHGVLHLLGYDHEADHGEMSRLERRLRQQLGLH